MVNPLKLPPLEQLSHKDLLQRCMRAESKLSSIATNAKKPTDDARAASTHRRRMRQPPLEYNNYGYRKIAIKIAYFGGEYDGFASQAHTYTTVEHKLFDAMEVSRLVPHRPLPWLEVDQVSQYAWNCDYSRCGRTDKGVSALCQVIALNVRSNAPFRHPQVRWPRSRPVPEDTTKETLTDDNSERWRHYDMYEEIPYAITLNRLLPPSIRVVSWVGCTDDFSARFSTESRTYKYFFPRSPCIEQNMSNKRFSPPTEPGTGGISLNIESMQRTCELLVGTHWFKHFAKYDRTKEVNYIRDIVSAQIEPIHNKYDMPHGAVSGLLDRMPNDQEWFCLTVEGSAFLWRQIRCLVGYLYQVGGGVYSPDYIKDVLRHPDSFGPGEVVPERPNYIVASPSPLILWECKYLPHVLPPLIPCIQSLVHIEKRVNGLWQDHMTNAIVSYALVGQLLRDEKIRTPPMLRTETQVGTEKFKQERQAWLEKFGDSTHVSWAEARLFFAEHGTYCSVTERINGTLPGTMKKMKKLKAKNDEESAVVEDFDENLEIR